MATRKTTTKKPAKPAATKDPLARELGQIAKTQIAKPPSAPVEGADDRIRQGWRAHERAFVAGLEHATPEGRALWSRAQRYVEAGMPLRREDGGPRDVDEQAAFYVASSQSSGGTGFPTTGDFARRWIAAGGLRHAVEVGLRAGHVLCSNVDAWKSVVLVDCPRGAARKGQDSGFRVLAWLATEIAELDEAARQALRAEMAPLVPTTTAAGVAYLSIAFDDGPWAAEAVRLAEEEGARLRAPAWPLRLFDVLRDGEAFAHLLGIGGASSSSSARRTCSARRSDSRTR